MTPVGRWIENRRIAKGMGVRDVFVVSRRRYCAAASALCLFLAPARIALPADLESVKVELDGVFVEKPKDQENPNKLEPVSMGLWAHGLSARYVVTLDSAEVTLETPKGERLELVSRSVQVPLSLPRIPAVQAALGKVRLFAPEGRKFEIVPVFSLRSKLVSEHWSTFLRFSATLHLQAAEYVLTDRIPPKPGAASAAGKVQEVIVTEDSMQVRMEGVRPAGRNIDLPLGEVVYVLQNAAKEQALLGRPVFEWEHSARTLRLAGWEFRNADSPTGRLLTREWLSGAELVVLELRKVAAFTRTVSRDPLQLSFDIPGQRGKVSDYDVKILSGIILPANATKAQTFGYVQAILAVSKKQNTFGYEDPQVAMLMKVGPGKLDVLMDSAPKPRTWRDIHIWKAMREIVSAKETPYPGHKELILARLEGNPDLAELLRFSQWSDDARPILIKGLRDGRNDLPASWIEAIIAFRDPGTYPALTDYYLRNPTEPGLYESIRDLPGIDLRSAMPSVWETAKKGNIRAQSFAIHPACEWGVAEALATAADWLRPAAGDYQHRVGRAVFKKFTPAEGGDSELVSWYDANREALVFDADKKMFLPRR